MNRLDTARRVLVIKCLAEGNSLRAAVALHVFWYNWVAIHGTLRVTPAIAAGVTDKVWDAEDVIRLLG